MAKKPGPKPNPEGRKGSLIAVKCSDDFKAWVEEFAEDQRIPVPAIMELGVVELAKARGFTKKAPKR